MKYHFAMSLALLAITTGASAQQTPLENGVLAEINYVRADPQGYIQHLRAYRALIGPDHIRHDPGDPVGRITFEGTAAVDEAIAALQIQPPLPPLAPDPELAKVARAYAMEQGRAGATGHVSADGTTMSARIRRNRMPYGPVAETISYGQSTPADVVRQLVVDDGVPSRGHRKILFTSGLGYAGVGCAPHRTFQIECVQDYSATRVPPDYPPAH